MDTLPARPCVSSVWRWVEGWVSAELDWRFAVRHFLGIVSVVATDYQGRLAGLEASLDLGVEVCWYAGSCW